MTKTQEVILSNLTASLDYMRRNDIPSDHVRTAIRLIRSSYKETYKHK